MRRLPAFIRIAGLKHRLIKVDDLAIESGHDASEGGELFHRCYGTYQPGTLVISLDSDSGSERTKATLLHEVLHSVINIAGLDMPSNDEEEFVDRMAPLLLDFIRANRGAISYLQES